MEEDVEIWKYPGAKAAGALETGIVIEPALGVTNELTGAADVDVTACNSILEIELHKIEWVRTAELSIEAHKADWKVKANFVQAPQAYSGQVWCLNLHID